MIILKDAYVLTLNPKNEFGRYSLLIDEERIVDITKSEVSARPEGEQTKVNSWLEHYSNDVEVVDCCNKVIMPPLVNSCLKSDGSLIKYLLRYRGYEKSDDNLYTDFMFNYIYQELQTEEMKQDIANIYNYSFSKHLKSGAVYLNEFTLRKDSNHLIPITASRKLTGQKINVCYPIKHDEQTYNSYKHINPAYYLTDESQLTIYDISQLTEQKKKYNIKLFLEVSTNKEVVDKFRTTFNKPILMLLDEYGLIDETTTLVNPIYLSYDEIRLIAEKKANITICPRDLSFFSNRYFPIDEFLSHGIKFNIATGWLGEDLFKEIRLFRNKYRELNLSNEELLMSIIKVPRELYFHEDTNADQMYCIAPNKTADLLFFDISDIRFILLPENNTLCKICDFVVDNLSSLNISDVMINGDFKIRDSRIVYYSETEIIERALSTRKKLYNVGKYKEISERSIRREDVEKLDVRYREEEDIKLFSNTDREVTETTKEKDVNAEFRIKGKIPILKRKSTAGQKTLFENTGASTIIQVEEFRESPEINLLFSEIDETKGIDDEIIYSKIADAKILKQTTSEKKSDNTETERQEGKIQLPKNVKLKFGEED
jgi:cytosine/adenosine deaminase-related metal-dependent hydrolase